MCANVHLDSFLLLIGKCYTLTYLDRYTTLGALAGLDLSANVQPTTQNKLDGFNFWDLISSGTTTSNGGGPRKEVLLNLVRVCCAVCLAASIYI